MKKLIQNVFVRAVACMVCVAALLGMLVSSLGILFLWNFEDRDVWYRQGREKLMENYALYVFDHIGDEDLVKRLEETNLYVSVVREDGEEEEILFSTIPEGEKIEFSTGFYEGTSCRYNTKLLIAALCAGTKVTDFDLAVPVAINGYAFDAAAGLFYYKTPVGYFKVTYLEAVTYDGETYDYLLSYKDGKECYYNGYYKKTLDTKQYESWDRVRFNGNNLYIGMDIDLILDTEQIADSIRTENYYLGDYELRYVSEDIPEYQVSITVADELQKHDLLREWDEWTGRLYGMADWVVVGIWGSLSLFLLGIVLLIYSIPKERKLRFYHKIPIGILTLVMLLAEGLLCTGGVLFLQYLMETNHTAFLRTSDAVLTGIVLIVILFFVAVLWMLNVLTRVRTGEFLPIQ